MRFENIFLLQKLERTLYLEGFYYSRISLGVNDAVELGAILEEPEENFQEKMRGSSSSDIGR